jgi:two-component sensor histidine kinase
MSDTSGLRARMPQALKQEADHRIANNLAMLSSLLRLYAAEAARSRSHYSPTEVSRLLLALSGRVETVATLHKILAGVADDSLVRLDAFLHDISTSLCALSGDQVSLLIDCTCDESIEASRALPMGLVVVELVTNSLKYAHPSGLPVLVTVTSRRRADQSICIEVSDDGVGFPEGFDPSTQGGLGFRVMRALVKQINAKLEFTSDELGACCRIIVHASELSSDRDVLPARDHVGRSPSVVHDHERPFQDKLLRFR